MRKIFYCLLFFYCSVYAQDWQYLGLNTESIHTIAVDWSNPNIIYAGSSSDFSAGTVGGIFKSTNGGAAWDTLIRGVTAQTIVIHPKNPNIIYATLGINGLTTAGIIKSTDGGANWIEADNGIIMIDWVGPDPLVIDPEHPDTIYAGTAGINPGGFYRSTDGGANWYSFGNKTNLRAGVIAIAVHPDSLNVIYAGTNMGGFLLKSTDYGVTWTDMGLSVGLIYSIQFGANPSTMYVGAPGENGISLVGILKTTDGSITWSNPKTGLPDTAGVVQIQILKGSKERTFLIAAWRGGSGIYESTDGGEWKKIGICSGYYNFSLTLAGTKLYLGDKGIYVKDITTSVSDYPPSVPSSINLYQNYPNPFNPSTEIEFSVGTYSHTSLRVYDLLGREVATLVNENKQPGSYTVRWNGEDEKGKNVSSGIYFYRLNVGGLSVVKKMVMLR